MRKFAGYAVIVSISVLLFDLMALLLPRGLTLEFDGYRRPESTNDLIIGSRASYPRNYFVAHSERGFDIGKRRTARHYLQEWGFYDVWSNELGCFDDPYRSDETSDGYVYLAGDSYTWGFAPFEHHFGSLLEKRLGVKTVKCGVTNTGQRHQFSKFLDVTELIGKLPSVVVVNYVANDIADDYSYPTSTVMDGWMVNRVELSANDEVVPIPREETLARMARMGLARIDPSPQAEPPLDRVKRFLKRYSASLHIVLAAKNWMIAELFAAPASPDVGSGSGAREKARRGYWALYDLKDGLPFADVSYSGPNRQALIEWQEHAQAHGYELIVSLVASSFDPTGSRMFDDVRTFLEGIGVTVFDSARHFTERHPVDAQSLYWKVDGHFNIEGQSVYADFLAASLRDACVLESHTAMACGPAHHDP